MCNIIRTLPEPTIQVGYKVAIKIGNRYYSPATGVRYRRGKVPKCPKRTADIMDKLYNRTAFFDVDSVLDPQSFVHNTDYNGNTAVFRDLARANSLMCNVVISSNDETVIVILVMTIMCTMEGDYAGFVYIGDKIVNIREHY